MRQIFIGLVLFLSHCSFSQASIESGIFGDTSLFFIRQVDSMHRVNISTAELIEIDEFLIKAVNDYNAAQRRYADSINPHNRKNRAIAIHIDVKQYYFSLTPIINKNNQKEVWLSGQCKDHFVLRKRKVAVPDRDWKSKSIQSEVIFDGGSCYFHLIINLTLRSHEPLAVNGQG